MQPQTRDAGFMDFLKRAPVQPARSNPLSKFLKPEALGKFLETAAHMNVTDVSVDALGFGVKITVTVFEDKPLNRTRTLERAIAPMQQVIEEYLGAPVDTKVGLDVGNPMFDPTEGFAVYQILVKADYPTETARNASASRVASKVMLHRLVA